MKPSLCIGPLVAMLAAHSGAQVAPDPAPLSMEEITARGGKAMSRAEVLKLVTGANVQWSAPQGGEKRWTNEPNGEFWGSRIGTGVGSFNPHYKGGRGKWLVREDGGYCVHIDYGRMAVDEFCWLFFEADGHVLMNVQPAMGGQIRFSR